MNNSCNHRYAEVVLPLGHDDAALRRTYFDSLYCATQYEVSPEGQLAQFVEDRGHPVAAMRVKREYNYMLLADLTYHSAFAKAEDDLATRQQDVRTANDNINTKIDALLASHREERQQLSNRKLSLWKEIREAEMKTATETHLACGLHDCDRPSIEGIVMVQDLSRPARAVKERVPTHAADSPLRDNPKLAMLLTMASGVVTGFAIALTWFVAKSLLLHTWPVTLVCLLAGFAAAYTSRVVVKSGFYKASQARMLNRPGSEVVQRYGIAVVVTLLFILSFVTLDVMMVRALNGVDGEVPLIAGVLVALLFSGVNLIFGALQGDTLGEEKVAEQIIDLATETTHAEMLAARLRDRQVQRALDTRTYQLLLLKELEVIDRELTAQRTAQAAELDALTTQLALVPLEFDSDTALKLQRVQNSIGGRQHALEETIEYAEELLEDLPPTRRRGVKPNSSESSYSEVA